MGNSELYSIMFYGEVAEGQSVDVVKQKLAAMFKLSAQQIDETFTGHPVVIKDRIDRQTALRYKAAFERAGAVCWIKPLEQTQKSPGQPSQPQPATPAQQHPQQQAPQRPVGQQPKPTGPVQQRPQQQAPQHPVGQQSKPPAPVQQRPQQQISASARQPSPQQVPVKPQQQPSTSAPEQYSILFTGEIAQGNNLETVKNKVAAVFRINSSQVAALFTGKPVVVKENVDRQTALQYKAAFERAGAVCQLVPIQAAAPAQPTPPPLPQSAATTGAASPKPGMMTTCPKCGFEQKESLRCSRCGIFIKNYLKAQQQAEQDQQEFQEGMEEEEHARELQEFEDELEIERQEAIAIVHGAASWLFVFAAGSLVSTIFWGQTEFISAIILAVLGAALRWFYSRTAAILTFVVALFYLIILIFAIFIFPIGVIGFVLRTIVLLYAGIRCISKTFQLHGDLADPNEKPSQLAYLVEVGLILSVVLFFGFVGYQVYKVARMVTTTVSELETEFGDLAEQFEAMSQFWQQLPDGSFMYVEFDPWPIPAGEPVTMHVWTSAGPNEVKNVKRVDYLLTFSADGFGEFTSMEMKESSTYEDMWEATVVVNEQEPFLRLRFVTTTIHGTIDLDGMQLSFE